jgi:hypothetical protein
MLDHRQKIAAAAKAHAPCSAHVHPEVYIDIVVPPADRVPGRIEYFTGPKPPSTCALAADGALRLAGVTDQPFAGHYVVGTAIANLDNVAAHHKALRLGTPDRPLHTGDISIIDDGSGKDAHVITFTGEPDATNFEVEHGAPGYMVDTVEGGQLPDSSGIEAFTRSMVEQNGKVYCGHRFVVAWIDADALGIGDDTSADAGDPVHDTIPIPSDAVRQTQPPSGPDDTHEPS